MSTRPFGRARTLAAWGVHAYTACGAVFAYLALRAVDAHDYVTMFWWLAAAFVIDCSDGTLARAVAVKQVVPWYDGTKLDDIVDYLTYVLVPVVFLAEAEFLPATATPLFAAAPLFASAYGFCRTDAKTEDHYFRGFPSYWNVFAFYAWVLGISPAATGAWLLALSALVFAPIKIIYPSRAPRFRRTTVGLGIVWAVALVVVIAQLPTPSGALVWTSLAYPAYYFLLSFWLQATDRR